MAWLGQRQISGESTAPGEARLDHGWRNASDLLGTEFASGLVGCIGFSGHLGRSLVTRSDRPRVPGVAVTPRARCWPLRAQPPAAQWLNVLEAGVVLRV